MVVAGSLLAYPFARDAIESQSVSSYNFQVTLTPPAGPAVSGSPTAAPAPAATSTAVGKPLVLPDDSTAQAPAATSASTVAPSATATSAVPPSRIVIPVIGLDAPVETVGWHTETDGGAATSVWDVPDRRAAGWLKTSAPAGQPGNTVLDGHHNINGLVFRYLVNLKPGDLIDLYAGSTVYHYAVTEKHILLDKGQPLSVRMANAQWIQPTTDDRLTLVTCWPFTNNTHRLIIVAMPTQSPSSQN